MFILLKRIVKSIFKGFYFGESKSGRPIKLNTQLTLLILTLNGHNDLLNKNTFYLVYKVVFKVLYWSIILLNGINLYMLRSDFIYILAYFLVIVSFVLMVQHLRRNQKSLNLILDTNRCLEATQDLNRFNQRQRNDLKKWQLMTENVLVFYLFLGVMGSISNMTPPFIYLFFTKYLMGGVYTLIYPAYWPLDLNLYRNYIPHMMYQICCDFMYPIIFYNTIPFLNFCLELKRQCKILCYNIENNVMGRDGTYHKSHFIQCVQHHCVLTERILCSINKAYGGIVSNVLLFSVTFNCISAYNVLGSTQQFTTTIKFLVLSLVFQFQLFVYCLIGSDISDLNDQVRNAIFNTPWYKSRQMRPRRDFIIWLTHCHRPVRLLYAQSYVISLSTFVLVCRLSYNIFNVLIIRMQHSK